MVKFLFKKPIVRVLIPSIAIGMLVFAVVSVATNPVKHSHKPAIEPASNYFEARVSGVGIIEPKSELISIGTNIAGIVSDVFVKVNNKVKAGDTLFKIDDRQVEASLALAEAELQIYEAEAEKLRDQYNRYIKINDKRAVIKEELIRREFALKEAVAKVTKAIANISVIKTTLDRLVVKAPIDGEILQVNIRKGEFAQAGFLTVPLLVIGDTSIYHVRVEIEQTDALNVDENAMAMGVLRGYADKKSELIFVRKEPLVKPKTNLTGDSRERVDTRIQQIIYAFDNSQLKAQIGQQMDISIEKR